MQFCRIRHAECRDHVYFPTAGLSKENRPSQHQARKSGATLQTIANELNERRPHYSARQTLEPDAGVGRILNRMGVTSPDKPSSNSLAWIAFIAWVSIALQRVCACNRAIQLKVGPASRAGPGGPSAGRAARLAFNWRAMDKRHLYGSDQSSDYGKQRLPGQAGGWPGTRRFERFGEVYVGASLRW
jgi:hypothetical protein